MTDDLAPVQYQAPQAPMKLPEEHRFEVAQREAKLLSTSTIIPDHYRGNMGNCYIAVHAAKTLRVDPLMFMQQSYVVSGKLGVQAKLVISLINTRGPYVKPLRWEFTGKPGTDEYTCTCYAHRADGSIDSMALSIAEVKALGWWTKANSFWPKMTQQMFRYRTASWLANAFCPEVTLGFQTTEELHDMKGGVTIESSKVEDLNERLGLLIEQPMEPETIELTAPETVEYGDSEEDSREEAPANEDRGKGKRSVV